MKLEGKTKNEILEELELITKDKKIAFFLCKNISGANGEHFWNYNLELLKATFDDL